MAWVGKRPVLENNIPTRKIGEAMRRAGEHRRAMEPGFDLASTLIDRLISDHRTLRQAAASVLAFDWSDCDPDAVAAIERLRAAVEAK